MTIGTNYNIIERILSSLKIEAMRIMKKQLINSLREFEDWLDKEIKMSAKLTCDDGTIINISAETEKELRKAFGEQTYPVGTWFKRDCVGDPLIVLSVTSKNLVVLRNQDQFFKNMGSLNGCEKVSDTQAVPMSIIRQLTGYEILHPVDVNIIQKVVEKS